MTTQRSTNAVLPASRITYADRSKGSALDPLNPEAKFGAGWRWMFNVWKQRYQWGRIYY